VDHQAVVGDDVFSGAQVIDVGYEADNGNDKVLAGSEAVDKGHDTVVKVCEATDMDRGAVDNGLNAVNGDIVFTATWIIDVGCKAIDGGDVFPGAHDVDVPHKAVGGKVFADCCVIDMGSEAIGGSE